MPWSGSGAAAARGWPAKDVVAHLGALFWMVVDPSTPPDADVFAGGTAPDPVVDALPDPPRCRDGQLDAVPGHTAGQSAGDDGGYWYATRP